MIEKSLIFILFLYAVSFSLAGGQYVVGDVFGITLVNMDGVPIELHLIGFINQSELNQRAQNIVEANFTGNTTYYDRTETFATAGAYVAWELITLLSGTYIFYFLLLMGMPEFFVIIFLMLYLFLLARTIIGVARGI